MATDQRITEEAATKRRADLLQVRYFDTTKIEHFPMYPDIFTIEEMYKNRTVVMSMEKGQMIIAITTTTPQQALSQLRERFMDYQVSYVLISEAGFNDFMVRYNPPEKVEYKDISIKPEDNAKSVDDVSATIDKVRPDDIFNYLVRQGHVLNASDIHIETNEEFVRIRVRVDGVLHEIAKMTHDKYRQLSSTIAIAANIGTSSPEPQTGHMNHKIKDDEGNIINEVNMRIETVPTLFGQDVVIRIFNLDKDLLKLENLGLSESERAVIDDIVEHPNGLVLSVGPTGSGKTTTLYSIINRLNTPERKIITLEDPVEYTLPGIVQIPVDTGHNASFADSLRSVLRLDPDVIMIGEIRDADTAKTALQAALSGHLVLSTFHASDTTAALTRLSEFLGDNPLFTSAIRLIIAQRLVRRLDADTKQKAELDDRVKNHMRELIDTLPEGIERPNLDEISFYNPGTSESVPFGYIGQTAIVELLKMTPNIEHLMYAGGELSSDKIREQAMKDGMITLMQDAVLKAADGQTSIDEIYRVVG